MIISALLMVVSLGGLGGGQGCENAKTTAELLKCLDAQVRTYDARLKRKESGVIKRMSPADADLFRRASTAWHNYLDLQCESEGSQFRGGTLAPAAELNCRSRLTLQRLADLEVAFKKTQ